MDNQQANPKGILNVLTTIHFAITLGLIAVGMFFYWLRDDWVLDFSSMDYKFPYVVPLSAVLGFIASRILFKRHIETLKSVETLGSKLSGYMTGSLIKYACLEAPGFFGLFAAQASGNMAYLLITALMALIMVFERPRKEKAERDLNLNKELRIELEKAMKVNK